MGAYSESVDAISPSQTVGEGRPVMGAYSESVDVTESQDPLKADVNFPPLRFGLHLTSDCGKLRRSLSNACPCACSHLVFGCAKKREHEDAIAGFDGAGAAAAADLPLHSRDRRADTRASQSVPPARPPCYNEVFEHDSEPETDHDPEMPCLARDERDEFAQLQAQKSWSRRATYGINGAQPRVQVCGSQPPKSRSEPFKTNDVILI